MSLEDYSNTQEVKNVVDTGVLKDGDPVYQYDLVDTYIHKNTLVELIAERDLLQSQLDRVNAIITEIGKL